MGFGLTITTTVNIQSRLLGERSGCTAQSPFGAAAEVQTSTRALDSQCLTPFAPQENPRMSRFISASKSRTISMRNWRSLVGSEGMETFERPSNSLTPTYPIDSGIHTSLSSMRTFYWEPETSDLWIN